MTPTFVYNVTTKNFDKSTIVDLHLYPGIVAYHSMIPNLPTDTSSLEVPKFYSQIAENLRSRLGHHENWWTHKRDPSVCPICDIIELSIRLGNELEMNISKSALDLDDQFLDSSTIDEGEIVDADSSSDTDNRPGDI